MLAGDRPSNDLKYSPLIYTSDFGRTWSNGVVFEGLASHPDALAADSNGEALALVDGTRGSEVLIANGALEELEASRVRAGTERLVSVDTGESWRDLSSPPLGTETVSFTSTSLDALAVSGSELNVWRFDPLSDRWSEAQTTHVSIQYGSSS